MREVAVCARASSYVRQRTPASERQPVAIYSAGRDIAVESEPSTPPFRGGAWEGSPFRRGRFGGSGHSSCSVIMLKVRARELPMKAFLLLVTWLAYDQPPSHYQVPFNSNETCEAARQQLIKDAERIRQAMIDRATAQDPQIGSGNKTSLLMAAIANAPYVSAVCVAE
jgi:hypothetical protein